MIKYILCTLLSLGSIFSLAQTPSNFTKSASGIIPNRGQLVGDNGLPQNQIKYYTQGAMATYFSEQGFSYVLTAPSQPSRNEFGTGSPRGEELANTQASALAQSPTASAGNSLPFGEGRGGALHRIDITFENANPHPEIVTGEELPHYYNYYYGHCPDGILNVHPVKTITYKNVWPNIDILFVEKEGGLEYDFIVNLGGNPNDISLKYNGAPVILNAAKGLLTIQSPLGEITEHIPAITQENRKLEGSYELITITLNKDEYLVRFNIQNYNPLLAMIIDPWATYIGGNEDMGAPITYCVGIDPLDNVLVSGSTISTSFPVQADPGYVCYQNTNKGNEDVFIGKFTDTGDLLWLTFFGGSNADHGTAIKADNNSNIYVCGSTRSRSVPPQAPPLNDFPTGFAPGYTCAYPISTTNKLGLPGDGILMKFDQYGNRLFATYFGGKDLDGCEDIAVDGNSIIIVGRTGSTDLPIPNGVITFQSVPAGGGDGFVARFNLIGNHEWTSYYGGTGNEIIRTVTVDLMGSIILGGVTSSATGIASAGAHQTTIAGSSDLFLVKFIDNNDMANPYNRDWATYYGGTERDGDSPVARYFSSVKTDNNNNIFFGATSRSNGLSTPGAFQVNKSLSGFPPAPDNEYETDNLIVKFSSQGILKNATYFGGTSIEGNWSTALDIDQCNNVVLMSSTESTNLNFGNGCPIQSGTTGTYIAKFSNNLDNLLCGSYYGINTNNQFFGLVLDSKDNILLIGRSGPGFPTSDNCDPFVPPFQANSKSGSTDAILVKLCPNCGEKKEAKIADKTCQAHTDTIQVCAGDSVLLRGALKTCQSPSVCLKAGQCLENYVWKDLLTQAVITNAPPFKINTNLDSVWVKPRNATDTIRLVLSAADDCCGIKDTVIIIPGDLFINAGLDQTISCTDKADLAAVATLGTLPYTYQWTGGPAMATYDDRGVGRYYVTVTDGIGCKRIDSVDVNSLASTLDLTLSTSNTSICYGSRITLTETVTGGTGSYTYTWSNDASVLTGAGPHEFGPATTGTKTYTLTVSDENGCEKEQSVTVNVWKNPDLSATVVNANCGQTDGEVTLFGSNGNGLGVYTYSFNGSAFTSTTLYTGLAAGSYLAIVDDGYCTGEGTINISNDGGPTDISTTITPATCNNTDGGISITGVTAGTSPYTYSFNGSAFTGTTSYGSLSPGSYPLLVKDASGCQYSTSITITQNGTVPTVTISGNSTICQNQSTTLTANGGTSWLWNTGATTQSITVNPSTTTTYEVTGSNGTCAAAKKPVTVTVTVNTNPTAVISGTTTICQNQSTMLTATGGSTFAWNTGATTASITVNPAATSTYTVTVRAANNCTNTKDQEVTVNAQPAAPSTEAVGYCHNEPSTVLTATGSNLLWYTAATGGTGSTTAPTPSTATVGSTDFYVSQTVGSCQSPRAVLTVAVGDLPAAPTVSTPLMYCQNILAPALTANGSNLLWYTSANGGTGNTTAPTPLTTTVGSSTYYVSQTVTGCESARESITVTVKPLPTIITSPSKPTINSPDTTICVNTSTLLRAAGAGTYSWSPANLLQTTSGNQVQTTPLGMGLYTITVTGTKDGCTSSTDMDVLVLDEIPPPIVSGNQNICKGEGVTLVATTSINPAQFFWYKDSTLQQIIINQATLQTGPLFTNDTTFYTNILYGNCASGLTFFFIDIKSLPQITITGNQTICSGDNLNLTASGGDTYRWYTAPNDTISNNPLLDAIADDNTSTYYILVKDSACIAIDTVQVQVNPLPPVDAGTPVGICKEEQTQLGTPLQTGISYQWQPVTNLGNPKQAQPTFTAKQVGRTQYTLTATDISTGCDQSDNVQVEVYELPVANITVSEQKPCADKTIMLIAGGGLGAQDRYEWMMAGQVFDFTTSAEIRVPAEQTPYILQITTNQNCTDTAMIYLKGENCDATDVYLPDMFTPNGDGENDYLQIFYKQGIISADVSIFDRWGSLVYTGTKESEPWNGTVKGQELPEGLYVYIIDLRTSKKSFNKIGTIAIGR